MRAAIPLWSWLNEKYAKPRQVARLKKHRQSKRMAICAAKDHQLSDEASRLRKLAARALTSKDLESRKD